MTCSIQIKTGKPVHEVRYVPDPEMEKIYYDVNVEEALLDLYQKVGYLKQRIERLENDRSD